MTNSLQKRWTLFLASLLVLSALLVAFRGDKGMAAGRTTWEYKVLDMGPNEADLNRLGSEGWEAVLLIRRGQDPSGEWVFKRPR
jgi:hypothetical protein